jgi:hypothetical protein
MLPCSASKTKYIKKWGLSSIALNPNRVDKEKSHNLKNIFIAIALNITRDNSTE